MLDTVDRCKERALEKMFENLSQEAEMLEHATERILAGGDSQQASEISARLDKLLAGEPAGEVEEGLT